MRRAIAAMAVSIVCAASVACRSPEASRTRGGGPGADVRNRPATVKMHEGSHPFWKTPDRIGRAQHPPMEAARQADRLSRQ